MSVISIRALRSLLNGMREGCMTYIHIQNTAGEVFGARVVALLDDDLMLIETTDGVLMQEVQVDWITWLDVRPFERFTKKEREK